MSNETYTVSVITPSHNADMALMKKAFDSLKGQTYGFEKIEWVIVVHNSSDENYEDIQKLVAGCENVKVYRLNNDNHTPSSPRNYAIPKATGKYLSFLDCDDFLTTDVFERSLPKLEENGAEIGVFRYETISA